MNKQVEENRKKKEKVKSESPWLPPPVLSLFILGMILLSRHTRPPGGLEVSLPSEYRICLGVLEAFKREKKKDNWSSKLWYILCCYQKDYHVGQHEK